MKDLRRGGFTLIELLIVIGIIGILAALLLPALQIAITKAKVKKARMQISAIVNAITQYESTYGRYPTSDAVTASATGLRADFTFSDTALQALLGPGSSTANNSEVIAILMDMEKYPNTSGPTVNLGHVKNTQQIRLLSADMVGNIKLSGVGPDLVYRDPWGNPYIISMDLSYDGSCRDALYRKSAVSQQNAANGYGLFNSTDSTGLSDAFEYHGGVMVWSLGPDGKADLGKANAGANKDNIVSWN